MMRFPGGRTLLVIAAVLYGVASHGTAAAGKPHICFKPGSDPAYAAAITERYGYKPSQVEGGAQFELAPRWFATATDGPGLAQGDPTVLTWSYLPDGTSIPGGLQGAGEPTANSNLAAWLNGIYGNQATWHALFVQFFARWSELSGITYVYEPTDDGAGFPDSAGALGVRGDIRIGAHFVDGDFGILAYNFFPQFGGDMVIDSADAFFDDTSNSSLGLRNVLAHEAGHGIGLDHSCPVNQTKLMEPFVSSNFDGPQFDDILGVQRLYGDFNEHNDDAPSATMLAPLMPADHAEQRDVSVDGTQDSDVFGIQLTAAASSVSFFAAPTTQAPYSAGPQLSNGNCTSGNPPYDPNPIHDISLQLIDTDGSTVLHTRDVNPAGQPELLQDIPLTGPATYYLRVSGDGTSDIQLYDLDVDVAAMAPFCPGVPTTPCTTSNKGALRIKADKKLSWKYRGTVDVSDFAGLPASQDVGLCVYRDGQLLTNAIIPAGSSGWSIKPGKKLRYKNKAGNATGVTKLRIRRKGLRFKLNGSQLPSLPLKPSSEIRLQLVTSGGACYETPIAAPIKKDTDKRLKARQK